MSFYDNLASRLGDFSADETDNETAMNDEIENQTHDSTPEEYQLMDDKGPDITFTGLFVGAVSSKDDKPQVDGRWTELALYRTGSGKYVVSQVGNSTVEGEVTRYRTYVADSESELVEKVGYGWLAKNLYDLVGISHAKSLD